MELVIIGGGVSGLIAGYVASQHRGVSVRILEQGRLGGEFLAGGLKYIHRTDEMASMLSDLGVVFTNYMVDGAIHLRGQVLPFPAHMRTLPPEGLKRIQEDHYRKTRRTEPDGFMGRAMNDPEANLNRRALRCDAAEVVHKLAQRSVIVREVVTSVLQSDDGGGTVFTRGGAHHFDYLINTIPLWLARGIMPFPLPPALAMRLNLVNVGTVGEPYAKWDYVYTPYTPDDLIHRISPYEGGYTCEFNGPWADGDEEISRRLTSDLNFLFPDGFMIQKVVREVNGHLLPLEYKPVWPDRIKPLGRFAQWETRATSDVVLDAAFGLCSSWGWERRKTS